MIQITPKKPADINERNSSEQPQEVFPDINEVIEEDDKKFKKDVENLTKVLSKIGDDSDSKDEDLFEFEFYTGGKNQKFDDHMRGLGLSTSNLEFLDFIQSELGEQILQNNKLKIHIDTGNIYYDNKDTNKSIFSFVLNQQSPIHGIINYDLMYNRSYKNYFDWIFN